MKTFVVVVANAARAAEALRAAVGLTLRGDRVVVVPKVALPADPRIARALATLRGTGHPVVEQMPESADAVEVWT